MSNIKGPCMYCKVENPVFLHYIYHQQKALEFCTSCLLVLFSGAFCPICFTVYANQEINPADPNPLISCPTCPAKAHDSCVKKLYSASTSSPGSGGVDPPADVLYLCPSCSDPGFKFFDFRREERTQLVHIDHRLSQQLLAAAIISDRCVREAAELWRARVETLAKEAAEAHREAQRALEQLAGSKGLDNDDDDDFYDDDSDGDDDLIEISSGSSSEESDDDDDDDEESDDDQESYDEEMYSDEESSGEDNDSDYVCCEENHSEESSGDESG